MTFHRLVPPWLVLQRKKQFLVVALGEVMTCSQLHVDGALVAKRV